MKGSIIPVIALLLLNNEPGTVTENDPVRFLNQATFGATEQSIAAVNSMGIEAWVDQQLNMGSAYDSDTDDWLTYLEDTIRTAKIIWPDKFPKDLATYLTPDDPDYLPFNYGEAVGGVRDAFMNAWLQNALHGEDQLRQRMAYALSQIIVVSTQDLLLTRRPEAIACHQDLLVKHAFGNYAELLKDVALSTTMGYYLTHHGNKKADPDAGTRPDENFAREIMQLFTIGLYTLNMDGSKKLDSNGKPIPTYSQTDIEELARVFTGWDSKHNNWYGQLRKTLGDLTQPMEFTAEHHDFGEKIVLNTVIPATDPASEDGEPDIDAVITLLMEHPNTAPFVCKQLIQRLVTANPSPAYVQRAAEVFVDNGSGVRGDLKAGARAILLDPEARTSAGGTDNYAVKTQEPILALTRMLRAFNARTIDGWTENGVVMTDFYYLHALTRSLGQEPLHAESVFNFYSPDFIPSDSYFITDQLTAPEFEIQTDQILVNFSNYVYELISKYESNYIISWYQGNPDYDQTVDQEQMFRTYGEDYIGDAGSKNKVIISFDQEMNVFEQALEGDNNGDFAGLNKDDNASDGPKAKAVQALVEHLDLKLTASTMTQAQKDILINYLVNTFVVNETDRPKAARLIIGEAVRVILTSSAYMVQY